LRHPGGNRTGPSRFGHFCAEVPKSLHIGAYPRVLLVVTVCRAAAKPLQAAYDGSGLLASQTSGLTTRHLSWDSSTQLPLLLDDGQNSYIYGPNGLPVEQVSEEAPTYLHHDQLGSTRLLTNSLGEASGAFSFTPYGRSSPLLALLASRRSRG
jgi:hypothetical protein